MGLLIIEWIEGPDIPRAKIRTAFSFRMQVFKRNTPLDGWPSFRYDVGCSLANLIRESLRLKSRSAAMRQVPKGDFISLYIAVTTPSPALHERHFLSSAKAD
jgi:hypothetical protein